MKLTLMDTNIFSGDRFFAGDTSFLTDFPFSLSDAISIDGHSFSVFPGFTDVHVHFREPGFSYKETIGSGSRAAAHGGFTAVCTMPNLSPTPDSLEHLREQLSLIERDACIDVRPFGTITCGEEGKRLSDIEALAPFVCGFSDDGRGVDDSGLMREAMERAAAVGRVISAHCEDGTAPKDSPEAEWREIERDITLASDTKVKFHVCHISTKESVALIRDAKKSGVDITAETAPHYLLLTDKTRGEGGRFKMNPPLREEADRLALVEGILDGTVDMIATDHAPHSAEEKGRGFEKSLNGVVGLETSFPTMYSHFVKTGLLSLPALIRLMSTAPADRFGIPIRGYTVFDLDTAYTVRPDEFLTMGRSSPFAGDTLYGRCVATVFDGKAVYLDPNLLK
ncbi:MAG: dihydroorotase [Clostridia bacterium]|nr:dihydroorotase [Clostridia bacterium]